MAKQRAPLRPTPAVERRPQAQLVQRSAAEGVRVASRSTQGMIARSVTSVARVATIAPVSIQAARVSRPSDPAEREAVQTARTVVQRGEPANAKPATVKDEEESRKRPVQRAAKTAAAGSTSEEELKRQPTAVQRSALAVEPASAATGIAGTAPVPGGGGAPLPASVRRFMEPRFGADFGGVRIHTGMRAAEASAALNAYAFTVGNHIVFGRDRFQPETAGGRELIAHELTHTIQQGAIRQDAPVQRSAAPVISEHSKHQVQRLGISDVLNYAADRANYIPGFRLLTIVLGMNPINMASVERNGANILRALLELIPVTGPLIAQALDQYGILAKAGGWLESQLRSLGLVGSAFRQALDKFLGLLSWTDILDLDDVWARAKRIFTEPIDRLITFGKTLVGDILGFIREAILLPIARLAEGTRGYDILKAVLGEDPVTGEKVAPTPEAFIGGFLKLIGEEELWNKMQQAKALPRIWSWFQSMIGGLKGFVAQIPGLFVAALNALAIMDLVLPIRAFGKITGVFGGFVSQFVSWGLNAAWTLLEIVFDVVSPGALAYIKRTGAALKSILKNPMPFVGNLVKAAKLGFMQFADNFLGHLKAGLIDWLTGSLPGIYIPKAFSLVEIAKFAFSVLGLTWANIRAKLVKVIGEPAMKVLETASDIVVTLVRDGPAAAWDLIKEQLANLKDMVIGGITDFVVDTVVKKAIPKLIAMFIPGAGFISAILSIYDTVMVFVNKLTQIAQVVKGFIDSIVAIAAGQITPAAQRVESVLASGLSLAINFLAGFAGLGKVADKIMGVFNKIRVPVDKALDWLIGWIVTLAKKLGKGIVQAGVPLDPVERLKLAADAATAAAKRLGKGLTKPLMVPILAVIKARYGLATIDVFERDGSWWVGAEVNPKVERNMGIRVVKPATDAPAASTLKPMKQVSIDFKCNTAKYVVSIFANQLKGQEDGLNAISVVDWKSNRKAYDKSGRGSSVPQEETRAAYRKELEARNLTDKQIDRELARLAALHEPDLIAGGFNLISKLGSRYINSSIGSQWKDNVEHIEAAVSLIPKEDWPKRRINVKLKAVVFTPA